MNVTLVRPRAPAAPASLDDDQRAVVDRRQSGGAVIVVGGPGTGKTTTLVEAIAARVERDGVPADCVIALAPTRAAAATLRDQISARLRATVRQPLARTPHSYAFGLLRRASVLDGDVPPRLISGAEQDRILADLLAGHDAGEGRAPTWPASIGPGVRALRGFRDELRDLLMRAVERGLSPAGLAAMARRHERPEWAAAADVLAEYLDVTSLATPGAYDPAGIVDAAATMLATDEALLAAERERWRLVAVDDAHESTAATWRLLEVLAGGGRDLLLFGDPDAATQGFRGARPRGLAEATARFSGLDGAPAPLLVLGTVHRHGGRIRDVVARVAGRIGTAGVAAHRGARPRAADEASGDLVGTAAVHVLASAAAEAAFVAAELRRQHLEDGVAWADMAVVVRSARSTAPLRRAMAGAGVPVAVSTVEVSVRDESAVVPLRLALRCCLDPAELTPDVAVRLLTGPIGGMDAVALRRLRQGLRAAELAAGGTRSSDPLLVEVLADEANVDALSHQVGPRTVRGARRVASVLAAGRAAAATPEATAETVLWAVWDAAGLAHRWRRTALAGGAAGERADRDLDAVVALFEAASRHVERLPHAGPAGFLADIEGQDLPVDTLAGRAPDTDAVALVTASGAAGRQWRVVAVAGVQEGVWPDLRLRSSLLGAQHLADVLDGRDPPSPEAARREVLDDELRGFHVAVSRAREHLLVTAVRSENDAPSAFVDLVDPRPGEADVRPLTDVPRSMTLPALVAELRGAVVDPLTPDDIAAVAAERLADLAVLGVPGADPAHWYGLDPPSDPRPLRESDAPVVVSPSKVEAFERCALRWLLESSGGQPASSTSQAVGMLVHELAQEVPDGDRTALRALLAERIHRLQLGDGWVGERERARAQAMVDKFAAYVASCRRELVGVEQPVEVSVGRAVVRGRVDRLERDHDGRLVVIDLKTGRSGPTTAEIERHPQLGVYQLAAEEGGFEALAAGGAGSGGAVLVQLGTDRKTPAVQAQTALADDADTSWARDLVESVAEAMAGAEFPASANGLCRICALRRCCPLQPEGRQVGP